jgi:aspartyl protease
MGEIGLMGRKESAGAIAWYVLLAACLGAAPAQARPESALAARGLSGPCRAAFAAIPMIALASGHHVVEITLNGRPGAFLVDTGAGATIIHAPYAPAFALAPAAAGGAGAGAGGKIRLDRIDVAALAVGGTRTRLSRIYAMDLSYVVDAVSEGSPRRVQGLIGQDVLRDQKALIDFARSILYLEDPDSAGTACGGVPNPREEAVALSVRGSHPPALVAAPDPGRPRVKPEAGRKASESQ